MKRDVIRINEEKCNGCGDCVTGCPEGALQVIDGKARLINDLFCDGLGACIGDCPEGAIEVERREAEPYNERKVMENIIKAGPNVIKAHLQHLQEHGQDDLVNEATAFLKENNIEIPDYDDKPLACGCSSSTIQELSPSEGQKQEPMLLTAELRNWPVQLQLLNPNTRFFKNADLLIAADCTPFAYPNFHQKFLKGKVLIILCPKLDSVIDVYVDKLTKIFQLQDIKSITIVHMEVPCCSGIEVIVRKALERAQKNTTIKDFTISMNGKII